MSVGDVWQRFTGPATRVVQYAQEEAHKLGGSTVGTEHVLLGLLRESDGIAARVLQRLGAMPGPVRDQIIRQLGSLKSRISIEVPITWSPKAKRVLELALEEASELNPRLGLPNYIDTEHILLGVLREKEGQAGRVLEAMGVDFDRVRQEVITQLGGLAAVGDQRPQRVPPPPLPGVIPTYEIAVESEFSAAHCLKGYQGPCARLHGHNYRVLLHIAGEELDDCGMLLDFREVKRICELFVGELDHQNLNDLPAFENQNPTTENIARHIFQQVAKAIAEMPGLSARKVRPVKVTVYESARSAASYSEQGER